MEQLVTGDAVRLELRPASFASRAVSGAIDVAVEVGALFVLLIAVTPAVGHVDDALAAAIMLLVLVTVTVGVPVTVETLSRGRTLGKLVMGMRAVRDDGGPIRFRHALTRGLVGFVDVWMSAGALALLSSLLSSSGKRLGDLAAGTIVVRERAAAEVRVVAQMPPRLAVWAQSADIGRVPDALALSARQLLGRGARMDAIARDAMGRQIATALAPYVAPPPPAGTDPEAFLAAVLAERRRRDVERLGRQEQVRRRLAEVDPVEAALARARRP